VSGRVTIRPFSRHILGGCYESVGDGGEGAYLLAQHTNGTLGLRLGFLVVMGVI